RGLRPLEPPVPRSEVPAPVAGLAVLVLIVEHAAAAAKAGLAVAEHVPGEAGARGPVVVVAERAVLGHARIAAEQLARRGVGELRRAHGRQVVRTPEILDAPANDVV